MVVSAPPRCVVPPMPRRTPAGDGGVQHLQAVVAALDVAYDQAERDAVSSNVSTYGLNIGIRDALLDLSTKSQKASSGFTNIVTCLAIKAAMPHVDIRYHQVQIQDRTTRPAGFNFRGVSEKAIYPWLNARHFEGAKSGWQTRTFERPKPYTCDYDENIGDIKDSFLTVFDEIEENGQSAQDALKFLIRHQIALRDSKIIDLSVPRTKDIALVADLLTRHFFFNYKNSKGASRLPVLAIYAIYSVVIEQVARYAGMCLKPLQEHSAADSQTGAAGDIEVADVQSGEVFEAVEVKHGIALSAQHVRAATPKLMTKRIDRYYILTTHNVCEPDAEAKALISQIMSLYGCQLICNGVIPSVRYYLRLLEDPSAVLPRYIELLKVDKAVAHEHREVWNALVME